MEMTGNSAEEMLRLRNLREATNNALQLIEKDATSFSKMSTAPLHFSKKIPQNFL